jgi:7-keto-8-aminopelargonate synthetase-like enzyme
MLAGFKHEIDKNYHPVLSSFSSVYNVGGYSRFKYCFHREICSAPSDLVQLRMDDGNLETVINTCSYNYLGVRSDQANVESLIKCAQTYGLGTYINRQTKDLDIIVQLEKKWAEFLGTEDCIVHFMGYDTNAMVIPTLVDKETVLYSD